jgi:hypothetical protein
MRIIKILFLSIFLISCSGNDKLPVELMGSYSGALVLNESDKKQFKKIDVIRTNGTDRAIWYAYIRTNKPFIRYVEEVKVNGPTVWNIDEAGSRESKKLINAVVSEDKSTMTITHEVETINGFLVGAWGMNKDDPLGPLLLKVTIEDKVVLDFKWNVVSE